MINFSALNTIVIDWSVPILTDIKQRSVLVHQTYGTSTASYTQSNGNIPPTNPFIYGIDCFVPATSPDKNCRDYFIKVEDSYAYSIEHNHYKIMFSPSLGKSDIVINKYPGIDRLFEGRCGGTIPEQGILYEKDGTYSLEGVSGYWVEEGSLNLVNQVVYGICSDLINSNSQNYLFSAIILSVTLVEDKNWRRVASVTFRVLDIEKYYKWALYAAADYNKLFLYSCFPLDILYQQKGSIYLNNQDIYFNSIALADDPYQVLRSEVFSEYFNKATLKDKLTNAKIISYKASVGNDGSYTLNIKPKVLDLKNYLDYNTLLSQMDDDTRAYIPALFVEAW